MKKSARFLLFKTLPTLVAASMVLTACKSRTKLILMSHEAPAAEAEIAALLDMRGVFSKSVSSEGDNVTVVFHEVLPPEEKAALEDTLKSLLRASPASPTFAVEITETDPKVIETLQLQSKTQKKTSLDIELGKGAPRLLKTPALAGSLGGLPGNVAEEAQCAWVVSLKSELPTLTYKRDMNLEGLPDPKGDAALREAVHKLRKTFEKRFDNMVLTAEHKITTDTPAFEKWVGSMRLDLPDYVYLEFGTQVVMTIMGEGMADPSDFRRCAKTILQKSDDAFLGTFIFPRLAKNLTRYQFEDSRF